MPQATSPDVVFTGMPAENYGFKRIIYKKESYVATITINRPDVLNCFDTLTLKELGTAFLDCGSDDAIAVVVITGAGEKAFCTGADLKEQEDHILKKPNNYHKWMYTFIEMHDRLRNIGKPTIARLNGMVVGGGNELNMACDLAIAADHVTIRQVGAARHGGASGSCRRHRRRAAHDVRRDRQRRHHATGVGGPDGDGLGHRRALHSPTPRRRPHRATSRRGRPVLLAVVEPRRRRAARAGHSCGRRPSA